MPLQQMRWPSQRSRMAFWKVCIAGIRWPDSAKRRYQRHIDEHRVFNHRRSKQQSCQHQYQSRTPCTWILDVELSHSDAPTPVVATRLNNPFEPWVWNPRSSRHSFGYCGTATQLVTAECRHTAAWQRAIPGDKDNKQRNEKLTK